MNEIEAKQSARRERYLRDPLPVRLGNLASNLSRIESLSNHSTMSEAASRVVDESVFFIEWTTSDADPPLLLELLELQGELSRWRLEWNEIWNDPERRNSVARQTSVWSQKILERSGLLKM